MTITADGGWLTAILLIGLLFVGIMAYRKRWPSRRRALVIVGGSSSGESRQPAKEPEKKEKHAGGHGSKGSFPRGAILMWVLIIAGAIYIIVHIPAIIDGFFRFVGIKVVQPTQVVARQQTVVVPSAVPTACERLAGKQHTVTLAYGDQSQWVSVPSGGCITHVDNTAIAAQCSSNSPTDVPPLNASGDAYACRSDITTNWIRFMPPDCSCDGPVTVRYWFEAYKP